MYHCVSVCVCLCACVYAFAFAYTYVRVRLCAWTCTNAMIMMTGVCVGVRVLHLCACALHCLKFVHFFDGNVDNVVFSDGSAALLACHGRSSERAERWLFRPALHGGAVFQPTFLSAKKKSDRPSRRVANGAASFGISKEKKWRAARRLQSRDQRADIAQKSRIS